MLHTEAHLALGELDAAEDVIVRAQERAEAAPLPQQMAAVLCARGKVLLARGEAHAAVAAGREAVNRFDRAGNPLFSARAQSPQEREVADRVASGHTNREVAAALFLSEKTIGSHLARIYDKLGVHSRAVLAAVVARETNPRDNRTSA